MSDSEGITDEEKRARAAALGFARRDKEIAELQAALNAALSRNKELEESLGFYGNEANWRLRIRDDGSGALTNNVEQDGGRRARTAMNGGA